MHAAEIRARFLRFFEQRGHAVRRSASLVPADDPTLLFTNSGMVPFKKIFLGLEEPAFGRRATTSQKCVRAGGKHNDLEQVGHTARHHTFFEMLGNFSFGDYFKRDAIEFAWAFVTHSREAGGLGIDPRHVRVSVFREDDEARALWREIAGLSDTWIYGLGEKDNFWQMAETGPCGPCSELYVDLAHIAADWTFPPDATGEWTELDRTEFSEEAFVEGAEAGRFLEIWNLVFMQFDRQDDGTMVPLPRPSVDTGAGLERIAAVMQGVSNNYHTDLFAPLLGAVSAIVGTAYDPSPAPSTATNDGGRDASAPARPMTAAGTSVDFASFRVLADHARAVAFLLADGVFPSNDGRGYVLRRILRRAVRHAWMLGRSEPTLVHVVESVVATMGDAYPELRQRASHLAETTRAEEERFLATIDAGMARFDLLAPAGSTQGSTHLRGTIDGDDAFRLYDTYGFPLDLTELMARERGYAVDIAGFESALAAQRSQSREDRKSRKLGVEADVLASVEGWTKTTDAVALPESHFVGYDEVVIETQVAAVRRLGEDRIAILLRETPFYAESGGQVSDQGEISGDGWRVTVDEVRKLDGRTVMIGRLEGEVRFGSAIARVPSERRHDTERNHTATHLLHAALREVLGEHVHQAGSVVEPDRLRFDFTHHGPVTPEQLEEVEAIVNRGIRANVPVRLEERSYADAVASGAMALFGEKYGDVVRVVSIPGLSVELCGGTHVENTGQIGLFRLVHETGVAAGVRRIVALTGASAFEYLRSRERTLEHVAASLRVTVPPGGSAEAVAQRAASLLQDRRQLERRVEELQRGGGDAQLRDLVTAAQSVDGWSLVAGTVSAPDVKALQAFGDTLRERLEHGIAAIGATFEDGRSTMLVVSSDAARDAGLRADTIVKELAALAGGRGGGKPHMAQAGIPDSTRIDQALRELPTVVRRLLGTAA